jgi:putative NADPH-quinone reductase
MVVVGHPRPASLNHAVADAVAEAFRVRGATTHLHDLYAEGFDPVLRADETYTAGDEATELLARGGARLVQEHRDHLRAASVLAVVHPNWWGKPPAMVAGWLDRVLVPGVAYELDDAGGAPRTLLTLDAVLVVNTSDTTPERESDLFGDPLDDIWRRCVGTYLGAPTFERRVLRVVADSDAATRRRWLAEIGAVATGLVDRPDKPFGRSAR